MKLLKEFKEFAAKGSIVDLAVAVVIGGAFGKIVSAFVSDLVMPLVNVLTPGGDWRKIELTSLHFKVGDFAGTVVDFVIVAVVIFIVIVKMMGAMKKAPPPVEEVKPETKQCPECLEIVPKAARRCRACASIFAAMMLVLFSHVAFAQGEATTESTEAVKTEAEASDAAKADAAKAEAARIEAAKAEAAKAEAARIEAEKAAAAANAVEWKAQSKGGFLLTSGNSQATNAIFGLNASRKQGNNKLSLEGGLAYGKSNNLVAQKGPDPADPAGFVVTGYDRQTVVSANNWAAKGRYDRFLTENNSLYVSGQAAGDKVAGKKFFGGGQAGYSRQLLKDSMNLVVAELGYDFSYLVFETSDPSVSVHSARVFLGETLKLTPQTGMTAGVEGLFNLNKEAKAKNASDGTNGVDPFKDTRVNAKIGISTNLYKSLSIGLGFTFKYTQNPAPRPAPDGLKYDPSITYASFEYAEKVDTITEATLAYTFF